MALYLIGDIQGCDEPLERLLHTVDFSPSRDTLYLLGDLVNRGPASAAVLRRLMGYGAAARCLLGNHDLHLLAIACGAQKTSHSDTLHGVLSAPDREPMLQWLRQQRIAMLETVGGKELLMVHAGVLPSWTAAKTMALALEVESVLQSPDAMDFFRTLYGNTPSSWSDALTGTDRTRVIVNALTRLRFCSANGTMEFDTKDSAAAAPPGYMPWFDVPARQTANITVAFGHWSTLGWLDRTDVLAMDTGCLWGGALSALRIEAGQSWNTELVQVQCARVQNPAAQATLL
jgi:bis(5'-nucleosyl)-tetraphosphatase (symmetrical)